MLVTNLLLLDVSLYELVDSTFEETVVVDMLVGILLDKVVDVEVGVEDETLLLLVEALKNIEVATALKLVEETT